MSELERLSGTRCRDAITYDAEDVDRQYGSTWLLEQVAEDREGALQDPADGAADHTSYAEGHGGEQDGLEICRVFGFNVQEGCDTMHKSKKVNEKKRGRPRKTVVVNEPKE